jgi:hypothetical protein
MNRKTILPTFVLAALLLACSCFPLSFLNAGNGTPTASGGGPVAVSPTAGSGGVSPPGGSDDSAASPGYDYARQLAGQWQGTWTNKTYGSTGTISVGIDVPPDGTASFELTVTGNVLGMGEQPTASYEGVYDAEGLVFYETGTPIFGDILIRIDYAGNVLMTAIALPAADIAEVDVTGTIRGDAMDLHSGVIFTGHAAEGSASLTRSP